MFDKYVFLKYAFPVTSTCLYMFAIVLSSLEFNSVIYMNLSLYGKLNPSNALLLTI